MKNWLILLGFLCVHQFLFAQKSGFENTWYNGEKTSKIQVYKSSDNKFYGKIIWLKKTMDANNKPRVDIENPDEKLQKTPLMNLVVLKDFHLNKEDKNILEGGTIYDPNTGKTYCGKITFQGKMLKLRGHICGWSWLGKSTTWELAE